MLTVVFITTALLSLILFYYGTGKDKRVLLLSLVWILLIGAISYSGYFENTSAVPPRFLFVIISAIVLSVCLFRITRQNSINIKFLVAIHIVRIPVELMLYQLFLLKKVPVLMTFKGWNFDIAVGISAIPVLIYILVTKNQPVRYFTLLWNILGLIFLSAIVTMAALSSPLPFQQFAFDQPNIAVLQFPFIYLPAYIVPVVFLSHILTIQKKQCLQPIR